MKALPVYVPRNGFFFVAPEYYPAEMETVAPNVRILTAPLRFNQGIPYTELCINDELLEQKLVDPEWTLNPETARLDCVAFKLPGHDKLIISNVGLEVEAARFKPKTEKQGMVVEIDRKIIPLIIGVAELVTWTAPEHREDTPLNEMIQEDMYVRLNVEITGVINILDGHVSLLDLSETRVHSVMDRKGRTLDTSERGSLPQRIEDYFKRLQPMGYMLDVDWVQPDQEIRYEYEMVEECSTGKGLAWLVKGVLGAYTVEGYSADVVEPTPDTYGTTKLYLMPRSGKPSSYVVVEENKGLQPGWVNIEFFSMGRDGKQIQSHARFEQVLPHYVGNWAGAIGMFLVNDDHYAVTGTLPPNVPTLTTYAEVQAHPEKFIQILAGVTELPPE